MHRPELCGGEVCWTCTQEVLTHSVIPCTLCQLHALSALCRLAAAQAEVQLVRAQQGMQAAKAAEGADQVGGKAPSYQQSRVTCVT